MKQVAKLTFGTDGIRNKVGEHPFTQEGLRELGHAIAHWALAKYGDKASFLIAADTRYSGDWVKTQLVSGILSKPVTIYEGGILPTPALFHLLKDSHTYTCGIVISASHNPAEDNGIKLVDARTGKLTLEDETLIGRLINQKVPAIDYTKLGRCQGYLEAAEDYKNKIISFFRSSFLKGHKIVLDCAHGATYQIAPAIFKALGAEVITVNAAPNGYNINEQCGPLHPESLQKEMLKQKALIGFAFDGDGDRVIAVNKQGIVKDGDDILACLIEHPDYRQSPALVSTIMANQGFEAHVKGLGKEFIRTAVGDKHVAEMLMQRGLSLGGEPSGHIILNNTISTGDGILVALKLLETILSNGNSQLVSFTKFPQVLINVPIKIQKSLQEPPLSDVIEACKERLRSGRVVVRYSGTEPLIRVMVEDADSEHTKALAHLLATQLRAVLS